MRSRVYALLQHDGMGWALYNNEMMRMKCRWSCSWIGWSFWSFEWMRAQETLSCLRNELTNNDDDRAEFLPFVSVFLAVCFKFIWEHVILLFVHCLQCFLAYFIVLLFMHCTRNNAKLGCCTYLCVTIFQLICQHL